MYTINEYKKIKKIYNHRVLKKQIIIDYIFTTLCTIYLMLLLINFNKFHMPIIIPIIIILYSSIYVYLEKKQIFIKYKYIKITKYRILLILGDLMFILIIYFQKLNALILLIILPIDAFICYIEYKRFVENMNNI